MKRPSPTAWSISHDIAILQYNIYIAVHHVQKETRCISRPAPSPWFNTTPHCTALHPEPAAALGGVLVHDAPVVQPGELRPELVHEEQLRVGQLHTREG